MLQSQRAQQTYRNFTLHSNQNNVWQQIHDRIHSATIKTSNMTIKVREKPLLLHQTAQGMNHGSQFYALHPFGEQRSYFKTSCREERSTSENGNLSGNTYKQYKMISPNTRCKTRHRDSQFNSCLYFHSVSLIIDGTEMPSRCFGATLLLKGALWSFPAALGFHNRKKTRFFLITHGCSSF